MQLNRFFIGFLTLAFAIQSSSAFDLSELAQSAFTYSEDNCHIPALICATAIAGGLVYAHSRHKAHQTRTYLEEQRDSLEKNRIILEANLQIIQTNDVRFSQLENIYGQLSLNCPRFNLEEMEPIQMNSAKMKPATIPENHTYEFSSQLFKLNQEISHYRDKYKRTIAQITHYALVTELHNLFCQIYNKHMRSIAVADSPNLRDAINELLSEYCPHEKLLYLQTAVNLDQDIYKLETLLEKVTNNMYGQIESSHMYCQMSLALSRLQSMSYFLKLTPQYQRDLATNNHIEQLVAKIRSLKQKLSCARGQIDLLQLRLACLEMRHFACAGSSK